MDARLNELQTQIVEAINEASSLPASEILTTSEMSLVDATSTSKLANWRQIVWVFANVFRTHEQIVTKNAENSRPQNVPNYTQMVYDFIDGVPIIHNGNAFVFDLTGIDNVEERKIVKRCAVKESNLGILVKVATEVGGVLQPLTTEQANRLYLYIDKNTQPGVGFRLINETADQLKLNLTVYVDPLTIELATGKQLNVTGDIYPVKDAINSYLAALEFNGGFVKNFFSKTIEKASGVKLATINLLQWKYASLPFQDLGIYRIPNSGHFKINDADLIINYLSYAVLE